MNILHSILMVALGGALGSVARYLVSRVVQQTFLSAFPLGTFTVNLLGCLLIGILYGMATRNLLVHSDLKLLLVTGFCGGFTTFSTFSKESLSLIQQGNLLTAALYISFSVLIGILMVFLGMRLVAS